MAKRKQSNKALTVTTPLTVSENHDVSKIVQNWRKALTRRSRSGELSVPTTETYHRGMSKFVTWCKANNIDNVTDDTLRDWIGELREDYSPAAIAVWLAGVRSFFDWAVGLGRIPHNPAIAVKSPKRTGTSKSHKRQPLTDDEVKRVLAMPDTSTVAGARDKALLCLMAYNGCRTIEINRLNVNDIKTNNTNIVVAVQGKGRTEADEVLVICNPDAIEALHDWQRERAHDLQNRDSGDALFVSLSRRSYGERLSLRAIRGIAKKSYKQAGVIGDDKTTHSLRHSYANNMIRNGAPLHKVQSAMRHANINTTMVYQHELDRLTNPAEAFVSY